MTPEQFLGVTDLLPTPLLLIDVHGTILAANQALADLLKFSKADLATKTFYHLVKQPAPVVQTYLRACTTTREYLPGGFNFYTNAGTWFSCRTYGCLADFSSQHAPAKILIRIEEKFSAIEKFEILNKKLRISSLAHEIKNKEVALAQYGRRLNLALRATGVVIWELDLATQHLTRSENHDKLFGYAEELPEWTSTDTMNAVHPDDRHLFDEILNPTSESKDFMSVEYRIIWPDGTIHWLLSQGEFLRDNNGTPTQIVGSTIEITNFKMIEENLNKTVHARDEFLSIASHELRTPLTALKLELDMAKRYAHHANDAPFTFEKFYKTITNCSIQTDRLKILIDDLFDLSRITAGKLDMQFRPIDLSDLLTEIIEKNNELLKLSGSDIVLNISTSITIICDKYRIEQAITNLLTNAQKYGQAKPIHISLWGDAHKAIIHIKDHGMGISKDKHEKIFERFERAVDHNTISGLGLGLYITQEIIKSHHGKIYVESEPNKGATFTLELPTNPYA